MYDHTHFLHPLHCQRKKWTLHTLKDGMHRERYTQVTTQRPNGRHVRSTDETAQGSQQRGGVTKRLKLWNTMAGPYWKGEKTRLKGGLANSRNSRSRNQWSRVVMFLWKGGRHYTGEGNGNLLQYCCLENPVDRGAWQATVHGVARVGYDLAIESSHQGIT